MPHHSRNRPPLLHLEPAAVDIWCVPLESSTDVQALSPLLSPDEQARAAQFRLDRHALEFAFSRAMLRRILASYTGIPAESISFIYGASGKPALAEQSARYDIRFNLSHCAGMVLCIVARGREVGIDVEQIDGRLASTAIAELFFSANETARLRVAPVGCEAETFFTCWARKEAYVKARGIGAALMLPELDLPPPGRSVRCAGTEWTLVSFTPAPGYVAAIAVEGGDVHLRLKEYRMLNGSFFDARGESHGNRTIHAAS